MDMDKKWTMPNCDFDKLKNQMTPKLKFTETKDIPSKTDVQLKKINETLKEQLRLSHEEVESAKKEASMARKDAFFSKCTSVISIIISIIAIIVTIVISA